jgi:CRP-like cAMP-binding protein
MAEQLLDRVLRDIRDRMKQSRAAYEESRRLQAALAALDEGPRDEAAATSSPRRTARRAGRTSAKRAPRGENLRRIREAIEQRPGATAGEVASATGIARPTVATALGKLAREGEMEKAELPGGGVGYRRARGAEHGAESAAAPDGGNGTPAERGSAG